MKLKSLFVLVGLSSLFLNACSRQNDFLYDYQPLKIELFNNNYRIKDIQSSSSVDILWVIDNSGSMYSHQQNVIDNAALFMKSLTQLGSLSWKIGLISTDETNEPYVGFDTFSQLNNFTPRPLDVFQEAVAKLGTSGSGTEKSFIPIQNVLNKYTNFTRPGSALAVILVTDAPEQSGVDPQQFLDFVRTKKSSGDDIAFYGVFTANDLNCRATDDAWDYWGSPYEHVITKTNGKYYVLCSPNFGQLLSVLSKDLVSRVSTPRIYLTQKPILKTLKVIFQGEELKGGSEAEGALWFFDSENNSVVFYNLEFAKDDKSEVNIQFEPDLGQPLAE